MAAKIEVKYSGQCSARRSIADTFAYLSDVERAIPANFKGLEKFTRIGDGTYEWVFEKLGYSGYEIQLKFLTRFAMTAPHTIRAESAAKPGYGNFEGGWTLSEAGNSTSIRFDAKLGVELPIPGFLRGMAEPLAQKELSKFFASYLQNVEKNLSK